MARPARAKRKREPIYLRVTAQGTFEPASAVYSAMLRARKFRVGDLVRAELTMPRHGKHHRLVMKLLERVVENLDEGMTHEALLTILKIKTGRVVPYIDSVAGKTYWVPESISFESMDEGEFQIVHRDFCRVIARDYLPGMTPEQVAAIADMMDEA